MKRLILGCIVLAVLASAAQAASEEPAMKVNRIVVCERIIDREPVAADSVFTGVEKLVCFTEIGDAGEPTAIRHVWFHGGVEKISISLDVRGKRWRTYSTKVIPAALTGDWRVDVLDENDNKIAGISFKVR